MKNILKRVVIASLIVAGPVSFAPNETRADDIQRVKQPGNPYKASSVPEVDFQNTARIKTLLRDGQLYLSLDDAIALAVENNLDVELQRYTPGIADTDLLRAKGGGLLRGLPLLIRQMPSGVGGPASPLLTNLGGGSSLTQLPGTLPELAVTTQQQKDLSIQGPADFSTGPPIPHFDPSLQGQLKWNHQEVPQVNPVVSGSNNLVNNLIFGDAGIQLGLSPGTSVSLNYGASRQNTNSLLSDFNPYLNGSLGLTIVQPVLSGFGPGINQRFIRIARNNKRISDSVFRQQLVDSISDTVRLYWDLVSLHEDVKVKENAAELAQKLVEDNRAQVEVGTLPPLELKRAQAELARTQQDLTNALNLLKEQELILKNVLTRNAASDTQLAESRITPLDRINVPEREDLPPVDELISRALANRPDLAAAHLQIENSQVSLRGSKNALLPELDLVAGVQSNALAGQLNPLQSGGIPIARNPDPSLIGGYGTTVSQLFNGKFPNYVMGFQLNIPLQNRVARADLARDQLQLRQTEVRLQQLENQIRLETQNARLAVERARTAYMAALQTRQLQEEALAAEQERYSVGASTSFFVIQYERDLTQARSTEVAASGAYAKARATLDRVTGATLENNHISVEEAYQGVVSRSSTPPPTPPLR